MNPETTQATETTLHGQIKAKWGKLSELEINEAEKNMESLSGKIQKVYGRARDVVDQEVSEFRKSLPSQSTAAKVA